MHAYQGWAGFIGKLYFGLFLGALYIANQRSFWMAIMVHGFVDTLGFLALYFGWIG
jgi:membrane protease YdiL (CAAX protease family)